MSGEPCSDCGARYGHALWCAAVRAAREIGERVSREIGERAQALMRERVAREYKSTWRCVACGAVTPARAWLDVGGCPHFRRRHEGGATVSDRCRCAVFERVDRGQS